MNNKNKDITIKYNIFFFTHNDHAKSRVLSLNYLNFYLFGAVAQENGFFSDLLQRVPSVHGQVDILAHDFL